MKKKASYLLVALVTMLLVTLLYIVLPFNKVNVITYWINYSFVMLSLLVLFVTISKTTREENFNSRFLKMPLIKISGIYTTVQSVVFVLLTIINAFVNVEVWVSLLINIIILGVFTIGYIPSKNAISEVIETNKKIEENKIFIRELKIDVSSFYQRIIEKELKEKVYDFKEAVEFSDPISHESLDYIEDKISMKYSSLKKNYEEKNIDLSLKIVEELIIMMKERNKQCKLSKKKK